jgi:hypothetical protein
MTCDSQKFVWTIRLYLGKMDFFVSVREEIFFVEAISDTWKRFSRNLSLLLVKKITRLVGKTILEKLIKKFNRRKKHFSSGELMNRRFVKLQML